MWENNMPLDHTDTDPTDLRGNGGGADHGYPPRCLLHEAAITSRLDRFEASITKLVDVIGHPPDPTTGKPGSGMRGQWVAAINTIVKHEARRQMPSITEPEGEITGSFDREALVFAKRRAEKDRKSIRIKAIGAVIVAVIAAASAAATQIIPMVMK
jgi:hypothetical protein